MNTPSIYLRHIEPRIA